MFQLPSFFSKKARSSDEPTSHSPPIPMRRFSSTTPDSKRASLNPSFFNRLSSGQSLYAEHFDEEREPETLPQLYFKHGFLFPLLWICGAIVLISPLKEPVVDPELHPESVWAHISPQERSRRLQRMREAEMKWGKRCLWALVGLLVLVLFIVGLGVGLSQR